MVPYTIKESFSWMTPEFKVASNAGRSTIRIKGVAMRSDATSRNNRKYIDEELVKAARTFYEKPVTINHDMTKKVGTVKWMEYENGALEYIADINKQPYVDLLRNKSADIKGVSIEALYLHNVCPKCGDKFYSEQEFRDHMINKEYMRNYTTTEPHGIVGQALSLVLTPEEPGYVGTTIELMEKAPKNFSQLLETVIKTAKEKENMKNNPMPFKVKEQAPPPPEKEKPEDEEDEEEEKKAEEQLEPNTGEQSEGDPEKLSCPDGYHLVTDDNGNQMCEPDIPPPPMDNATATEVDANPIQPVANAPVGDGVTVSTSDTIACPVGQHRDASTGLCVADDATVEPSPNTTTETVKLPTLLRLGEPFAGYDSMDDCIAKNPDQDDPAAYCAVKMRKAEGEPATEVKESKDIYETSASISKKLSEVDNNGVVRDARIAETVNKLNKATAKCFKQLQEIDTKNTKQLTETVKKIINHVKTVESAANFNLLAETKKGNKILTTLTSDINTVVESVNKQAVTTKDRLQNIAESYNKLQDYTKSQLTKLATSIAETNAKIKPVDTTPIIAEINQLKEQLDDKIEKVTVLASEQKQDFETILGVADKNNSTLKEHIKSLEEYKRDNEAKLKETQQKEEESNAIKEALAPLQTEIENLKSQIKGDFQQKQPAVKTGEEKETDLKTEDHPYGN